MDPKRNIAIILGMQYFGELKKGTLTQAWGSAVRQGYVSCHGGLKRFKLSEEKSHVAAFFGLSGSGKSTLTHAKHEDKYDITVLHDDAFIIHRETGASIALEPSYFDKTNDYPTGHREEDYYLTVQNVGVTINDEGKKVLVTEDIRNGNGRTVKSRYSTPNRVDKIDAPIDAIYWIMKDESLPPILKVTDPVTASAMGATLVTKRSSAENVKNQGEVVVEPYANPFRVYPLEEDYYGFKRLVEEKGVDCYVINTGSYNGQDIPPKVTLGSIEHNVEEKGGYVPFGPTTALSYLPIEGYTVDFEDEAYRSRLLESMKTRLEHLNGQLAEAEAPNEIPSELIESIERLVEELS